MRVFSLSRITWDHLVGSGEAFGTGVGAGIVPGVTSGLVGSLIASRRLLGELVAVGRGLHSGGLVRDAELSQAGVGDSRVAGGVNSSVSLWWWCIRSAVGDVLGESLFWNVRGVLEG